MCKYLKILIQKYWNSIGKLAYKKIMHIEKYN